MAQAPTEEIKELIEEYLNRAFKSFIEDGSSVISNKIFKCPRCKSNNLELQRQAFRKRAVLTCLWVECGFNLEVPASEELEDFLKTKRDVYWLFKEL